MCSGYVVGVVEIVGCEGLFVGFGVCEVFG